MLPDASVAFYTAQQRRTVLALGAVQAQWRKMTTDFDSSWRTTGPRMTVLLAAAQLGAATDGAGYVDAVLAETNQAAPLTAEPVPRRLVGEDSYGRPLAGTLYGAVVAAKVASSAGAAPRDALAQGGRWLSMFTRTLIADTGRGGSVMSMVARPQVTGFVRMVNPPCCSRCAILAGKWFRYSTGFERHPRCDCTHIPASENIAGDLTTDPQKLLDSGQVTDISKADRVRLDAGDTLQQVVNDKRMQFPPTRIESLYPNAPSRRYAIRVLREQGYLK